MSRWCRIRSFILPLIGRASISLSLSIMVNFSLVLAARAARNGVEATMWPKHLVGPAVMLQEVSSDRLSIRLGTVEPLIVQDNGDTLANWRT